MRVRKFTHIIFIVTFFISVSLLSLKTYYEATQTKNEEISFLEEKGVSKFKNQFELLDGGLQRYRNFTSLVRKSIQYPLSMQFTDNLFGVTDDVFDRFLSVKDRMGVSQLRLVAENGKEIIRHRVVDGKVEKNEVLRNISDRYYYKEFQKSRKYIYFSDFDLNVENGVIVKPYIQTLRTITKVYFKGETYYLILNFNISNTMKRVLKTTLYEIFLTDLDGFVNVHLNKELFFAKQLQRDVTLQSLQEKGFHYITHKQFKDTQYNMVIGIKESQLKHIEQSFRQSLLYGAFASILISLIISLVLSNLMKINIQRFYRKVEAIRNSEELDLKDEYDEFKIVLTDLQSQHKVIMDIQSNLKKRVDEEVEKSRQHERQIFEQAKMVSMGEMIGNIAHQWRQPLSAITTNVADIEISIELDEFDEEELLDALRKINTQAQYLSETINTFRDFLKDDKTQSTCVLQKSIDTALDIVHAVFESNHIEIKKEIDYTTPVSLMLVEGELEQVIINILNNAKDALLSNKIANPWVLIVLSETEEVASIRIEDNAGGIPQDIIDKVFEAYFTTKHESQGTGLGLHMSYNIVTQSLGGKLIVKNIDKGAQFLIELPK